MIDPFVNVVHQRSFELFKTREWDEVIKRYRSMNSKNECTMPLKPLNLADGSSIQMVVPYVMSIADHLEQQMRMVTDLSGFVGTGDFQIQIGTKLFTCSWSSLLSMEGGSTGAMSNVQAFKVTRAIGYW